MFPARPSCHSSHSGSTNLYLLLLFFKFSSIHVSRCSSCLSSTITSYPSTSTKARFCTSSEPRPDLNFHKFIKRLRFLIPLSLPFHSLIPLSRFLLVDPYNIRFIPNSVRHYPSFPFLRTWIHLLV
ncbi:hypothetical protein C8Q75DRAFT_741215 [Abortiporus biennis]|nr:hypothetical protein C8Q75DRAFT_741215 [Abortiporus biennis]